MAGVKAFFFAQRHNTASSHTHLQSTMPSPSCVEFSTSYAAGVPVAPWDGKCRHCRRLMSKCHCYDDDTYVNSSRPDSAREHPPTHEKRHLLETLSGMHPTRVHARLPIKMTQDRSRDRRSKERRVNGQSITQPNEFAPSRSMGPRADQHQDQHMESHHFSRSCPDVKWRTSSAVTNTMRLAHAPDSALAHGGPPRHLLSYDNKKATNRFNQVISATAVAHVSSENKYLPHLVTDAYSNQDEENLEVWEL